MKWGVRLRRGEEFAPGSFLQGKPSFRCNFNAFSAFSGIVQCAGLTLGTGNVHSGTHCFFYEGPSSVLLLHGAIKPIQSGSQLT